MGCTVEPRCIGGCPIQVCVSTLGDVCTTKITWHFSERVPDVKQQNCSLSEESRIRSPCNTRRDRAQRAGTTQRRARNAGGPHEGQAWGLVIVRQDGRKWGGFLRKTMSSAGTRVLKDTQRNIPTASVAFTLGSGCGHLTLARSQSYR